MCTSRLKIFYIISRSAKQKGLVKFSKHQSMAFVDQGFGSWNKALERLTDHEQSQMHKESVEKLAAQSSSADIALKLHAQCRESQCFHREMLIKLLSSVRFLARQGLPFRGHSETPESFEGNLYQLLLLRAEGNDKVIAWLRRKDYLSRYCQ